MESFTPVDYALFVAMLASSALIGVYYGCFAKKKQNNTIEYLFGGKKMSSLPISASLIASHVSGIAILTSPAEIYANGTQYYAFVVSYLLIALAMIYIYLPVFYQLQLPSIFMYLEQRFDRRVRLTASLLFTLHGSFFVPIVIYAPALAFNQVTGINVHLVTITISAICIFYTCVGGLKAVVWADTIQWILMVAGMMVIVILGIIRIGGLSEIWQAADRGGRLVFFNLDPNPLVRTTFWTVGLGMTAAWLSTLGVGQVAIQRFLSIPDWNSAKKAVYVFAGGLIFAKSLACYIGLIMYAEYEDCDPLNQGKIQKLDQILPYYVLQIGSTIPGLSGLFIAGIFAAALSTMSSCLNTIAGTIYEDYIRCWRPHASEKSASNYMKFLVVALGFFQLACVWVVEQMGTLFQLAHSVHGIFAGAILAIFTLGMTSRRMNTIGTVVGATTSLIVMSIIFVGAQMVPKVNSSLPLSTEGCELANLTAIAAPLVTKIVEQEDFHWIFRISFQHYTLVGLFVAVAVGYPVSLLTQDPNAPPVDEKLLVLWLRTGEKQDPQEMISLNLKSEEIKRNGHV